MKALILKGISNLRYESTLSGLTLLAGLVGYKIAPELLPAIATFVVATVGLLKTFMSDADVA